MIRVLVAYSTSEGQSAHVAEFIAGLLEKQARVTIADLRHESPKPAAFDAVILGGSVHGGAFQKELASYIEHHREALNDIPSWFFGTSLSEAISGAPFGHDTAQRQIATFLESTGWTPTGSASVAGALKYRDYSWPKRLLMQKVLAESGGPTDTSRNWEYTNWEGVRQFAEAIAEGLPKEAGELSLR